MKLVNYLDVTLNLNNSNYKPYQKPDNEILYFHKDSNHPPSILKQIPTSIEKRISTLWSNETIFNESKEIYQKALEKSGYQQTLKYHPWNENFSNNKRNRKRNVIWFNLPFSANVKKNVRDYFLNLIRTHFRHVINLVNCSIVTPSKQATAACQILNPKYTNITKTP